MTYPSTVFVNKPEIARHSVNPEFFEDINLTKLLSKKALDIMGLETDACDIKARRQVFRDLEDSAYSEVLSKIHSLMGEMLKTQSLIMSRKDALEKGICFLELAEKYAGLIGICESSRRDNQLHRALSDTVDIALGEGGRELFTASLTNVQKSFEKLKRTEIDRNSRLNSCTDEPALNDILLRFFREITVDTELKNVPRRRVHSSLVSALGQKCTDEADVIKSFAEKYKALCDVPLNDLYDELGFYISVLALLDRLKKNGIPYCYPEISDTQEFNATAAYDISLLAFGDQQIVPNDIHFSDSERRFFLTGANGGGKTTYIRACAITLIMFINGCPVPCKSGKISPFSRIFTHFSKDERFEGSGRFVEEQKRIRRLNELCDGKTFVLLNETFSGTDEIKGLDETLEEMNELRRRNSFGIYVTHFHEINSAGFPILNAVIDESDSNRRTYKIVRSNGSESSYAFDILKKHSLTADDLKKRLTDKSKEVD